MDKGTTFADTEQQEVTIVVKDQKGFDDTTTKATWKSDDTSIASVQPIDAAQRTCVIIGGKPGQTKVTATCGDASLEIGVTITNSTSASIGLSIGQATVQPTHSKPQETPPSETPAPADQEKEENETDEEDEDSEKGEAAQT